MRPPRSVPIRSLVVVNATAASYSLRAAAWAALAVLSPSSTAPVSFTGGKPMCAVPAKTPRSPVMMSGC